MDLGPQALTHFVTLFLILMAIGVALIVDLLKGNNEQLRELAIELKAKKDAAEKHLQVLEVHTTSLLQPSLAAAGNAGPSLLAEGHAVEGLAMPARTAARPTIVSNSRPAASAGAAASPSTEKAVDVKEAGFHTAARKGRDEQPKREMSPGVAAVAESVAARMAAGKMSPAAVAAAAAAKTAATVHGVAAPPAMEVDASVQQPEAVGGPSVGVTPEIVPVEVKTGIFQAHSEIRKDWSRILTSRKHEEAAVVPVTMAVAKAEVDDNLLQFVPAVVPAVEDASELPPGFLDFSVLRKAAAAGTSLQGMVVSIGLNQLETAQMAEVSKFVQSLLEAEDFGCQSGSDEFIVVCLADPQSAQRRLSVIAEKLWDFQLRSMGQLNVQFAWGGMEARPVDKLNDVVAAAIDQMAETRRARRGSTVHIAKAV